MATKVRTRLEAEPRTIFGNQNKALRRTGKIPANIFGHGDATPIQIDEDTFTRMRDKHLTAGLIDLVVAGKTETVLVRHLDHRPKTGKVQHVDFMRVVMTESIHARVPVHIVGESQAAKLSGGVTLLLLETVEIDALPGDLPDALTIDASKMTEMDVILHAGDIALPQGVTLLTDATEAVLKVQPLRVSEEPTTGGLPSEAAAPTPEAAS